MANNPKDGGPAFPLIHEINAPEGNANVIGAPGMSLRQWYAGMALIGSVERMAAVQGIGSETFPLNVSAHAYRIADALIAQGEKDG